MAELIRDGNDATDEVIVEEVEYSTPRRFTDEDAERYVYARGRESTVVARARSRELRENRTSEKTRVLRQTPRQILASADRAPMAGAGYKRTPRRYD